MNYQRNKYLDDLGLNITDYGTNFMDASQDEREERWKDQGENYGFDEREIWNLDTTFIEWLYSHLMMYRERASKVVDLTFYKFNWNGEEITLEDAIDKITNIAKEVLTAKNYAEKESKYKSFCEYVKLYAEILPCLWY